VIEYRIVPAAAVLIAVVSLGGCSGDDGGDYCKHHSEVHADHIESVASLNLMASGDGELSGEMTIPRAALTALEASDIDALLADAGNFFTVQSDSECLISVAASNALSDPIAAMFEAHCGADNKLGRIDITLFDRLADLDELEASVTTTATAKHFAISRQCDAPIFRLE
tara:strand:+ start:13405 stop:13911 length:507 start_codon:yes stop_codon:yes gene_type:complete